MKIFFIVSVKPQRLLVLVVQERREKMSSVVLKDYWVYCGNALNIASTRRQHNAHFHAFTSVELISNICVVFS